MPDLSARAPHLQPLAPWLPSLAEGGKVDTPLQDMFWGDYFGSLVDRFGIHWMLNCENKS